MQDLIKAEVICQCLFTKKRKGYGYLFRMFHVNFTSIILYRNLFYHRCSIILSRCLKSSGNMVIYVVNCISLSITYEI